MCVCGCGSEWYLWVSKGCVCVCVFGSEWYLDFKRLSVCVCVRGGVQNGICGF